MQRPLQTHHLLISSSGAQVDLRLPPMLLHKVDSSHRTSWKVWISKLVMPSFIPNISAANNTFKWKGIQYYLWPGKSTAQDICYQMSSVGCVTKWSHVDNRFIFQSTGQLDVSALNSCADLIGLPRSSMNVVPGSSSVRAPRLGLLDYVVVHSSLSSNTHVWRDGVLKTNTQGLCTLPVNDEVTYPYEDLSGDRAVYYHSSLIDNIRVWITDAELGLIPTCHEPWHCTVTIAEVADVFEDQLSLLNKNTAELLDLKKINTLLKHNTDASQNR
jgi:hypothetical protein